MSRGTQLGHRRTLVVGAGLAGAALGYISSRAGRPTVVASADRPASQATALASGAVHGVGPPGDRNLWTRAPTAVLALAATRARRGFEVLQEVLLAAPRSVGYTRLPHELHPVAPGNADWLEQVERSLSSAGWPLRVEERSSGAVLVRERDALVNPRRLTFELLHQARAFGATVRLGVAYRGVERKTPEGLLVRLGQDSVLVHDIFWTGGRASLNPGTVPAPTRLVLHQLLAPGRAPLGAILETGEMSLTLAPDPLRPGCAVLVRMAEENPGGGMVWPETPAEWSAWRGPAVRQRLAEAGVCSTDLGYCRSGCVVTFGGMAGWPLSSILGACLDAFEGLHRC